MTKERSNLKCEVCGRPCLKGLIICSDECNNIRLAKYALVDKYFPTYGCDNCLGDLHEGCTDKCKKEFSDACAFGSDLWAFVRLVMNNTEKMVKDEISDQSK